jgi:hypothetical protein
MKYNQTLIISFCLVIGFSTCASENEVMLGMVSQEKLMTDNNFVLDISEGKLTDEELIQIKHWPDDLHIDIYFGTWCHDSQREVPRMLNILKENSAISTQLIALDYEKSDPKGLANNNGIKYTPTFIMSTGGKELGRIIERPKDSLVADITGMLDKNE